MMPVGLARDVTVEVGSSGLALSVISAVLDRRFELLSHVESVSPVSGSLAGGTELTISGGGFEAGFTSVTIDGVMCMISSMDYNTIVCVTGSSRETTADVTVNIQAQGQWIRSQCTASCAFTYSAADTPQVNSVSPLTVTNVDETVTISGTGFPDVTDDVIVYIGDTECVVTQSAAMEVICNAGSPVAGTQPLSVTVLPDGNAQTAVTRVTVSPGTPTIQPSSGSLGGGTVVTISGLGFSDTATMVAVGGSTCTIERLSSAAIVCLTPSGSAGVADVGVVSNGVTYATTQFTYDADYTAVLVSSSISAGSPGDTITFTATNMLADDSLVTVLIGDVPCTITAISTTSLACTLGEHEAGDVDVTVYIQGWGLATGDLVFRYDLSISAVVPNTGEFQWPSTKYDI
jgi:hypothetical protein